jgi:23S rRNA (guanine2445-N2)-methyltransferase / 23S rRNA (guanine2069-N7)-methyltransferase
MMARGMPPHAQRARFGVDGIEAVPRALWQRLRAEARLRWQRGLCRPAPAPLFGSDRDDRQVERCRAAFAALGLPDEATLGVADVATGAPAAALRAHEAGLVVANLPYGERIGGHEVQVLQLVRDVGAWLMGLPGFDAALLLGDAEMGFSLGLRAHKVNALYNGPLPVTLLQLHVGDEAQTGVHAPPADSDFFRRLQKNQRKWRKVAEQSGWGGYRAYDADVPEYRAAIDIYRDQAGGQWAYVQPYQAPRSVEPKRAEARVRQMLLEAPAALDLPPSRIVVHQRSRQRAGEHAHQYQRRRAQPRFFFIDEHDMHFRVSLEGYVDTGIYLDLRALRRHIRRHSKGLHVLNCFGYTGTMSVAAAVGGAASTTTVDKSATYLDWAAENFSANGLPSHSHQLVRADVQEYLQAGGPSFDLICIGAPTYSAGKWRASTTVFDVALHHPSLCRAAMRRLRQGGTLWFATHAKTFRLAKDLAEEFDIVEQSSPFCPPDFAARQQFRLWRLRHQSASANAAPPSAPAP